MLLSASRSRKVKRRPRRTRSGWRPHRSCACFLNRRPRYCLVVGSGQKSGFSASLLNKIDCLYRSSVGELATQSVLFYFTYFLEPLKPMGWLDFQVLSKDPESSRVSLDTTGIKQNHNEQRPRFKLSLHGCCRISDMAEAMCFGSGLLLTKKAHRFHSLPEQEGDSGFRRWYFLDASYATPPL